MKLFSWEKIKLTILLERDKITTNSKNQKIIKLSGHVMLM